MFKKESTILLDLKKLSILTLVGFTTKYLVNVQEYLNSNVT